MVVNAHNLKMQNEEPGVMSFERLMQTASHRDTCHGVPPCLLPALLFLKTAERLGGTCR